MERLSIGGYKSVALGSRDGDLREAKHCSALFDVYRPDTVIHLAAVVGGIGANRQHPGKFWRDNTLMGINVLDACVKHGVERLVLASTTCAYPKRPERIPFLESDMWNGYPEETNAPYGIAKKSLMVGANAYAAEYGLDVVTVVPTNLYGPGDNFDLKSSHVIPAMIRRMHEAKVAGLPEVVLWGTGHPTRDFLYVADAAHAIVRSMDATTPGPINLGSGVEVSMYKLATIIKDIVSYKGRIQWDPSKPDGQPRRCLDTAMAIRELNWEATTPLEIGLDRTYESYLEQCA
jgi:GDP-L-fucose synthase